MGFFMGLFNASFSSRPESFSWSDNWPGKTPRQPAETAPSAVAPLLRFRHAGGVHGALRRRARQPRPPPTPDLRVLRIRDSGYNSVVPGPGLRVRRGEEFSVRAVNELTEPTAVHWHGVRLLNTMDGAPPLTQASIAPGASFDYRFIAPDAGTFWYHPPLRNVSGSAALSLSRRSNRSTSITMRR